MLCIRINKQTIDTFNTINLKLFPTYPNPQTVHDYHVPVCTVDIKKMMNSNWDITVQKVANLIDGINHVKRISELANVKPQWTRQSLEHMMYGIYHLYTNKHPLSYLTINY